MSSQVLTSDLSDGFLVQIQDVALELCDEWFGSESLALDLLGIMENESDIRASAKNSKSGASGLIQILPKFLPDCGWTGSSDAEAATFRALTAEAQMPYVRRRLIAYRTKDLSEAGRLYQSIYLPRTLDATAGKPNDTAIAFKGSAAYSDNQLLDADGDGMITVADLESIIADKKMFPRCVEAIDRVDNLPQEQRFDFSTVKGVQRALTALNLHPNGIDGNFASGSLAALGNFRSGSTAAVSGMAIILDSDALTALHDALDALGILWF